jgi:hypothetical protein
MGCCGRRPVSIFFRNLQDEDIDDFHLRLIQAAIKMVEKALFRDDAALSQAQASSSI